VLDDLIHSYNNIYHRSIGTAPAEVDLDNEDEVGASLYPTRPKFHRWKYDGDRVRTAMQRRPFRKGYLGNWSQEVFEIASCLPTSPVTYELRDLDGKVINGRFDWSVL